MQTWLFIIVYLLILFVLAFLILFAKDKITDFIWRLRNPPEKLAAQREAYLKRIVSPDWQFYEQHLQRTVPLVLREFFSKQDSLTDDYFFADIRLEFTPIDKQAEQENWVIPDVVPFAYYEADPIFMYKGESTSNTVFIAYHDGGDIEEIAPSIEDFFSLLRRVE